MTGLAIGPPEIQLRREEGFRLAARLWRLPDPLLVISSAPLGGGIGLRHWVLNVQVPPHYNCDEPGHHLAALAEEIGLAGPGVGMMTAVDVRSAWTTRQEGMYVDATVGVSSPLWAAAADEPAPQEPMQASRPGVGTINIVVVLPERLGEAALVNAIATATEAKTQALWNVGVSGTGTATDALCILCPSVGTPHSYGGPRSTWGSRLARAVHRAVRAGCQPGGAA